MLVNISHGTDLINQSHDFMTLCDIQSLRIRCGNIRGHRREPSSTSSIGVARAPQWRF